MALDGSLIGAPVLQSTSNATVAALENVDVSRMAPLRKDEQGRLRLEFDQVTGTQVEKPLGQTPHHHHGKGVIRGVKKFFRRKSHLKGSSESDNSVQIEDADSSKANDPADTALSGNNKTDFGTGGRLSKFKNSLSVRRKHTQSESIHRRDSTESAVHRASLSAQDTDEQTTSEKGGGESPHQPLLPKAAHSDLNLADLEGSFNDAFDKIQINDTPRRDRKVSLAASTNDSVTPTAVTENEDTSGQDVASGPSSDNISSTLGTSNHSGHDQEGYLRKENRQAAGNRRRRPQDYANPLRCHQNVMEFASPDKPYEVPYAMPPPPQPFVPRQANLGANGQAYNQSNPRIEVTKDDEPIDELTDAPIYSESMNNLSQYARNNSLSARATPASYRRAGLSPRDYHNVNGRRAPARPPRPSDHYLGGAPSSRSG